ncbi:MAG: hypothetical protein ACI9MC_001680 [Kiritimatiellia bacterium]|jgi:hypothetical protein
MRWLWLWLVACFVMTACAAKRQSYSEEAVLYEMADEGGAKVASKRSRGAPSAPSVAGMASPRRTSAPEPDDVAVAPDKPAAKRMVFYEANTTLRVPKMEEAIDAISKTAVGFGGLVERVTATGVVVRVPVDSFREALVAIQAHGDVVRERIHAQDVTEAFADVSLRLSTAKATRDRLVVLLAKAEDEQEKLQLVREIQRLTEQIDRMQSQAQTLKSLASMSRITVGLEGREALANRGPSDQSEAFSWIRRLSPFGADAVRAGKPLRLDVPEGMVALSPRGSFVAEGPNGARIWSGRLKTDVLADNAFWITALGERLAQDFASAEVQEVGGFTVVRFVQREDEPYTWMVAIRVSGRELYVVEAFFANPDQAARFDVSVLASLRAVGGAS